MESLTAVPSIDLTGDRSVNRRNPTGTKGRPTGVRLDDDVIAAVQKLALKDDRSFSYVVNKILREYLRAKKLLK